MTINGKAYIAGMYEHPTRKATDKSVAQLHAESAAGALADAGLGPDVLEYFELSFCIIMIISISNYNSKLFFKNG